MGPKPLKSQSAPQDQTFCKCGDKRSDHEKITRRDWLCASPDHPACTCSKFRPIGPVIVEDKMEPFEYGPNWWVPNDNEFYY
jgi:hypothetical protein